MKPGSSSGVSLPLPPLPADEEAKRPWAEYDGRLYLWLLEFRLILCCLGTSYYAILLRMYAALLMACELSLRLYLVRKYSAWRWNKTIQSENLDWQERRYRSIPGRDVSAMKIGIESIEEAIEMNEVDPPRNAINAD